MARIELDHVTKLYPDGVSAVNDLSLDIPDGDFMVVVGPSGSGKSTALRMVAWLEELTSGEIRIGDRVVNDLPPKDRDIAMVFQNYALYPPMTAEENLAFGLRLHKTPRPSSSRSPRWPGCCRRDGRGPAPRQAATTWRALLCQQAVGILACAFWAYRALQLQAPDQPPVLRFVAADQDGGVHRPDLPGAWSTSIGELQNPLTHPSG